MKNKIIRLGELYAGPGGLALGSSNAKITHKDYNYSFQHEWVNESDYDSCLTFSHNIFKTEKNIIDSRIYNCDVKKLVISDLTPIDGLVFGFPCNDFSAVGKQKGLNGKFGSLYNYGVKVIDEHNPLFFIAENVGGIRHANEGSALKRIIEELQNAGKGYNVAVHLFKAEEYGVPQTRHRIFIVGFSKNSNLIFKVPAPSHTKENYISAKMAIEEPPLTENSFNHEFTRQSENVRKRLEYTKEGENAWTAKIPIEYKLNVKGAWLSQIYKRLKQNEPSYTITGSGGGGTHVYHWAEPRALTNRERARLQSFPDNYHFYGSKEAVRKQIGMAVPPLLAKNIFLAILKTIIKKEYAFVKSNIL